MRNSDKEEWMSENDESEKNMIRDEKKLLLFWQIRYN